MKNKKIESIGNFKKMLALKIEQVEKECEVYHKNTDYMMEQYFQTTLVGLRQAMIIANTELL